MANSQDNILRFQEIANRGLQDNLDEEKRAIFDEAITRGLVSMPQAPESSIGEKAVGVAEAAGAVLSGAAAEPVAGIAGLLSKFAPDRQFINPSEDMDMPLPDRANLPTGGEVVEDVRQAMTYQPRTEEGQEAIQSVGEFVEPVAEAFGAAENYLGNKTLEVTGSPALAAAASAIPTAISELIGIASAKGVTRVKGAPDAVDITREVLSSAPSIEQLKTVSRAVFKEIDEAGVTVKPNSYRQFASRLQRDLEKSGLDPDITPKAYKALTRIQAARSSELTLTELDTLRTIAQNAASSIDAPEKMLGSMMVRSIDDFIDDTGTGSLLGPAGVVEDIAGRYKVARDLWGRARRSELLQDSFETARNQASGFENGIRIQFRQILNNKKKRAFFKPNEIASMRKVVQGSKSENLARLVGKLGFSEGAATNFVGGAIGAGAGAAVAGPVGAILVPMVGQVSKKLAQRMTANNAKMADAVVRAGKDAKEIIQAYIDNTPAELRSPAELSELLMRGDIDLADVGGGAIESLAAKQAIERRNALGVGAISGSLLPDQE